MYIAENFLKSCHLLTIPYFLELWASIKRQTEQKGVNFISSPSKKMQQLAFFHLTMLVGNIFPYMSKSESKTLSPKHQCLSMNWCQNQALKAQNHKPHPGSGGALDASKARPRLMCWQSWGALSVVPPWRRHWGCPSATQAPSLPSSFGDEASVRQHHLQELCPKILRAQGDMGPGMETTLFLFSSS